MNKIKKLFAALFMCVSVIVCASCGTTKGGGTTPWKKYEYTGEGSNITLKYDSEKDKVIVGNAYLPSGEFIITGEQGATVFLQREGAVYIVIFNDEATCGLVMSGGYSNQYFQHIKRVE